MRGSISALRQRLHACVITSVAVSTSRVFAYGSANAARCYSGTTDGVHAGASQSAFIGIREVSTCVPSVSGGAPTMAMDTDFLAASRALIPRFTPPGARRADDGAPRAHKGSHGRILVFGGSLEYAGAPYYAAMSALYTGADLVTVVCARAAGPALKAASPELVVLPLLPASHDVDGVGGGQPSPPAVSSAITAALQRADAIVVGPGLGRDPVTLAVVAGLLRDMRKADTPVVIDGDGLFLVASDLSLVRGYTSAVLTPNPVEMQRIMTALGMDTPPSVDAGIASRVSAALGGATLLVKSEHDLVAAGGVSATVRAPGSPRRCGGQGDILAGSVATFLGWARKHPSWNAAGAAAPAAATEPPPVPTSRSEAIVAAATASARVCRRAAALAFAASRRATVASRILDNVGPAFEDVFPDCLWDTAHADE